MRGKLVCYSPGVAAEVIRRLKAGQSLYRICKDPQMPSPGALRLWARARPEFAAELQAARDPAHRKNPGGFASAGPGRPCGYSPELALEICERLADGCSLRQLQLQLDIPSTVTLFRWMARHPEFREMYLAACEARALHLRQEALAIADDDSADLRPRPGGGVEPAREVLQRAKLRIDLRMKQAASYQPRKPGPLEPRASEGRYEELLRELTKRRSERGK